MIEIKITLHEAKPKQMAIDVQGTGAETATKLESQAAARIKTALDIALQSLMHTHRNGTLLEMEKPSGVPKRLD